MTFTDVIMCKCTRSFSRNCNIPKPRSPTASICDAIGMPLTVPAYHIGRSLTCEESGHSRHFILLWRSTHLPKTQCLYRAHQYALETSRHNFPMLQTLSVRSQPYGRTFTFPLSIKTVSQIMQRSLGFHFGSTSVKTGMTADALQQHLS